MPSALLIIDVQKAILRGKGTATRQPAIDAALDRMVNRLAELQHAARARNVPVILVQHDGDTDHRLAKGTDGWQIRGELRPASGDVLVHKTACDAFFETDLKERLKERRIGHLIVGGCMTQFCVDTTCRRAASLGYDVTLLGDGHMTADMGDLTFEQIIAHHNAVLDGFDAGAHAIHVAASNEIQF
jgi:nicotinamidase-related amidase